MSKKQGKPKKLYLTEEERGNIQSREIQLRTHEYHVHLVNNDIVAYIKDKVYKRLGLDPNKDYPLAGGGTYLIVEEEKGTNEPDTTVQKG